MNTETPSPQLLLFGLASSVYCYIVSSYQLATTSLGTLDLVLAIGVKMVGIVAGLTTIFGFIFKYEKKFKYYMRRIREWFKFFN